MKKLFLIIIGLLLAVNSVLADESVSFVYINGSNNNDVKMKNWYENGVKKLHPVLRKKFLNNPDIKNYARLNSDNLIIKEDPVIFFWGYDSKKDLEYVKKQLEISKMVSSSGAYIVRTLITQYMHDAIWVQKTHHMISVLEDLNATVKEEVANTGNDIVLYGYSAGTFVTYEYMFRKFRYINLLNVFEALNYDKDFIEFVKANPKQDTCISALAIPYGKLGTMSSDGHLVLNPNKEQLKANYLKMDETTEAVCAPKGKIAGIVNFASPLPLFYSDFTDSQYEQNYYNKLMIKYILENGIFFITVNYREDPLGFPTSRNVTIKDIQDKLDMEIVNPTGVIYDDSGVWSKRMFAFAHTSYWSARRTFSKAIVKSFVNGYKFQYDEKYQKKVIKRNRRISEL